MHPYLVFLVFAILSLHLLTINFLMLFITYILHVCAIHTVGFGTFLFFCAVPLGVLKDSVSMPSLYIEATDSRIQ